MQITYFQKEDPGGMKLATFGVYLPGYKQKINNLAVLKSKNSGWYIVMPTFKRGDAWEKTVVFDEGHQVEFLKKARQAVEVYLQQNKQTLSDVTG